MFAFTLGDGKQMATKELENGKCAVVLAHNVLLNIYSIGLRDCPIQHPLMDFFSANFFRLLWKFF